MKAAHRPGRVQRRGALLLALSALLGCGSRSDPGAGERARLSLMLSPTERRFWIPLARSFETSRPGVEVDLIEGPTSTDLRENLYTTALLAEDDSLDLVYLDVTWTAKFAAAGWLLPLDRHFSAAELRAFLPAALDAGRIEGRLYRIPIRTDVGLLYYRRDLLAAAGFAAPQTFAELVRIARALQSPPQRWGFLWQGSQYEGLVCVFLEVLRGHGGFWIDPESRAVGLDRPAALAALEFLRRCRAQDPISPPGVTTYKEEESRRLFQDGRAVFLRNWPYVWSLVQREDSPIAGRVGVQAVVHAPGAASAGTLGGWGLGVSRFSRHPELARAFIRHATSLESQRAFCLPTGYAPARREAYDDPELTAANPFLLRLLAIHRHAVPRPMIPRYAMASDILQRHLSAALAGLESSKAALHEAAAETRLLLVRRRSETGADVARAAGSR
ncbi:MAG TPA: ABC transporter substrate-binding protein [Acidobacteriota bacterium]